MQPASVLPRLNEKDNFRRLIGELVSTGDPVILEAKYRELALVLSSQIKIAETHWQDFQRFLHLKIRQPDSLFLKELPNMAAFIFSSRSPLVHTIYESIPDLLIVFQRSLQLNVEDMSQRLKGIDTVVLGVYNNSLSQWRSYQSLLEVGELPTLTNLFGVVQSIPLNYNIEKQVNLTNKSKIKSFLLFLFYYHLGELSDGSVLAFFKLIYVFCGGKVPPQSFNFYLLRSNQDFSIFDQRISDEEFEWLLMSLYYIYVYKRHLKFQVTAALSLIRKKCGNECRFRVTEAAMSLLDLFENQYDQVF